MRILCEALEKRQLLSGAVAALGADIGASDPPAITILPSVLINGFVRVKGTFTGSYHSSVTGKTFTITIVVSSFTHTGHFKGTVSIETANGTVGGTVSGHIRLNRHLTISLSGHNFTATLIAKTTRTGGRLSGSYTASSGGTDTGTFTIGKA